MPTAGAVAAKLRELADGVDKTPDAEIHRPYVSFYSWDKKSFLNAAKGLLRPLKKSITDKGQDYARFNLTHETDIISIRASVPQSLTCKLVTPAIPAVYDCDPILSPEEDAELEVL